MKVHYCDKCRELIESDNYKNIYCTDKNKGKYWFETYELCEDCFTDFEKFIRGEKNMSLLITQKKGRLIRRCFYFTTLLKKCQYGLHDYIEKVHANQKVSQRNVVFMRCSYICLAIFHNFFNYKRILV